MLQHHQIEVVPFVPDLIKDSMKSKKYQPADLLAGTAVFYRGERYFIESCPKSWDYSAHVYISDIKTREGEGTAKTANRFGVHPDLLELAPTIKGFNAKQPTQKAVIAKADREAKGIKDAGDIVAETLRGLDLDQKYAVAAAFMLEEEQDLRDKYGRLNPGQQSMNLSNRMRAWLKKNGGAK
jgi:hypothetical protein